MELLTILRDGVSDLDGVRLLTRDTDHTAASDPVAGGRITYIIGSALHCRP